MIWQRVTELLSRLLFGSAASRAGGVLSGLGLIGAIAAGVAWLLGPGREWTITLNALELSGVVLLGSALLEWMRRVPPPGG
jgi:hypothetical protein